MRLLPILSFALCLTLFACKEKQKSASAEQSAAVTPVPVARLKVEDSTQTYFSVKEYLDQQWNLKKDNPYTLLKIVIENGRSDSSFVPFDSAHWFTILQPFYIADIGDKKYLGWYRFDSYKDEDAEEVHIRYEAVAPDTIMRKMDVAANPFSGTVNLVYMETRHKIAQEIISRKMTYKRDDFIQIIESRKEAGRPAADRVLEYRFKY